MAAGIPPYDPELIEPLKLAPQLGTLTKEILLQHRAIVNSVTTIETKINDPAISHEEQSIPGPSGNTVDVSILRSRTSSSGLSPGILYMHGGGMMIGNKLLGIEQTFEWVKQLDAVVISVEYRLAPDHPSPAALDDCYAALKYVNENAKGLGIDAGKIIVAGHSAGGGLAAGVALLARDRDGPELFAQCLIYPMLDDRGITSSSKQFMDEGTWSGKNNIQAWEWYIPGHLTADEVSIYASPSRAKDLSGLPQTWIDVGGAETFRDENVAYATQLAADGVSAELHVWPGAWHSFDVVAPNAAVTKVCLATRMAWFKRILSVAQSSASTIPVVL